MPIASERDVLRSEFRWGLLTVAAVGLIFIAILTAALAWQINPPSNVEMIDPKTLHLSGEFTEDNLGTQVQGDTVAIRMIASQFAFLPRCVVAPRGRPVTLRLVSPDVIHGILVTGTNVNTMVVPGYVSQVHTTFTRTGDLLMPCHEFCGMGHSQMWATIRVVESDAFQPDAQGRVACAQR
jgi:cytochrome c oxidase subunit II